MIINSTIKIGHASTDSASTAANEVLIGELYKSFTPTVLLRPKSNSLAERSAKACEAGCNNNNIEYSQGKRNTLNSQAKSVNYDLSAVTSTCYTDCSSYMTVCAIAGGATFGYGYGGSANGPTTSNMKSWFTSTGDYTALTDSKHLSSTDYLRRGDILVAEGSHALMVLSNGSMAPASSSSIDLTLEVTSVGITSVSAKLSLQVVEAGEQKALNDPDTIKLFNWSYKIESLSTGKAIVGTLNVYSGSINFSIENLTYNSSYRLSVEANYRDNTEEKLNSSSVVFKTLKVCPVQVKNLTVEIDENILQANSVYSDKCKISFNAPSSWGDDNLSGFSRGYRTSLLINGKVVAFKDNLFNVTSSSINQWISLNDITKDKLFNYADTMQIGIQAWLKDQQNNIIFDNEFPICSKPIFLKYSLNIIDKFYIKMQNEYKKVVLYNKEVD